MSDRDYLYGHVCVHGSLALSCEMCDLEDFLDEVQEAWTRAEAENARLRAERTAMLDALDELEYLTRDACVEQDGPYVDGVRLDELQDARAVLDHARTLIGDNRE